MISAKFFYSPPLWMVLLIGLIGSSQVRSQEFAHQGFIELSSLLQTENTKDGEDTCTITDVRGHLEIRYGSDDRYLFLAPDLYLSSGLFDPSLKDDFVYSKEFTVSRNLTLSGRTAELAMNEAYVHYGTPAYRLRAGNQIFGWGTADAVNPTAFFNARDLREAFFRDDDEFKEGLFALSGMVFLSGMTLELVMAPLHTPAVLPADGTYWQIDLDNFSLPVTFDDPEELDVSLSNTAWGARLSSTVAEADASVSLYHGPDRDLLYVPTQTIVGADGSVSVLVKPQSRVITALGADFSKALGDLVFQGEAALTADKPATVSQSASGTGTVSLPYTVKTAPFAAYSLGFNYFVPLYRIFEEHDGDTVLTLEWYQARYLESGLTEPILSDLFSMRLQDSYLENRVALSLSALVDTRHTGYTLWPKLTYDFLNGLSAGLSWIHIDGSSETRNSTESLFYYFRDNDSVVLTLRYLF